MKLKRIFFGTPGRSRQGNEADCCRVPSDPPPYVGSYEEAAGRPRVSKEAAFTMVEIAICLGVIGFALVAIIGVLPAGMSVQKDNREETIINFDGTFLMNAIRTGAQGQDDLTNYIINITNYSTLCNNGVVQRADQASIGLHHGRIFHRGNGQSLNILTNCANIIGLLSMPKYIPQIPPAAPGNYFSNYTTADFRGLTADAVDQGMSPSSQDFAFKYRLYCEVMPHAAYAYNDPSWLNFTAPGTTTNVNPNLIANNPAINLQNNFYQMRLRFRWPILPNGQVANGRLVFRTSVSGMITNNIVNYGGTIVSSYYLQPGVL